MQNFLQRQQRLVSFVALLLIASFQVKAQSFTESFNDINTLTSSGWYLQNLSSPAGLTSWFQGTSINNTGPFDAYNGAANAYIGANFNNTGSVGTISNWMLTPERLIRNGDQLSFYTRKPTGQDYPDRLEIRLSTNAASTNLGTTSTSVGDFTALLLSINPSLTTGVYPTSWTKYTVTVTGLPQPLQGRFAFRYFVTNGGPSGTNADYIGIDQVEYTAYQCPPGDVVLNSQADVINFGTTYRYCDVITGNLTISGSDITDLSPLQYITQIQGKLTIKNNPQLSTLSGLGQVSPGPLTDLEISNNPNLTYCNSANICTYLSDQSKPRTILANSGACTDASTLAMACTPCPVPTAPTVQQLLASSARISWTAGSTETSWTLSYGQAGFNPQSGGAFVAVDGEPNYTLTGLTPGTAYQYYLKANCNPYAESQWIGPFNFTTPAHSANANGIIFVSPNGAGNQTGESWDQAYGDLNGAINTAGVQQVWVAAGTYKPTTTTDRNMAFVIPNGLKVYGGFAGNETQLAVRNVLLNQTILSGDIGVSGDKTDNTISLVRFYNAGQTTVLDGFTLTLGYNEQYLGGAVFGQNSSPVISHCKFIDNASAKGGAVAFVADNGSTHTPQISHAVFVANTSKFEGGALFFYAIQASQLFPSLQNVVFTENTANNVGGVVFVESNSGGRTTPSFTNSVFYNNIAANTGTVSFVFAQGAGSTVQMITRNCTMVKNSTNNLGGSLFAGSTGTNGVIDPPIRLNNYYFNNKGFNSSAIDPQFINMDDPDGADNIWMTADDGLGLRDCSPAINAGVLADAPALDILGLPVAYAKKDLGAYESLSEGTPVIAPINGAHDIFINQSLQLTNDTVGGTWRSLNTAVATISSTGLVQSSGSVGTATFSYSVTNTYGCTDSVLVSLKVKGIPILELNEICASTELILSGNKDNIDHVVLYKDETILDTLTSEGIVVAGGNGRGNAANQLSHPISIVFDADSNLYVVDIYNHRIQKWAPGASSGVTVAGGNLWGPAANQLASPNDVAIDANGNLYVADTDNHRVQKWAPGAASGITVAGGSWGTAANQFKFPVAIAIDASGALYISDTNNHRVQKWVAGATTGITVAGGNGAGDAANQLNSPAGLSIGVNGELYIADLGNHRIQKWVPGASSGITVAGGNGYGDAANQLNVPQSLSIDASGNLYIADLNNYRIVRWAPGAASGTTVIAGSNSQLDYPWGVLIDSSGNLYYTDPNNDRVMKWVYNKFKVNVAAGSYKAEVFYTDGSSYITNTIGINPVAPSLSLATASLTVRQNVAITPIVPQLSIGSNPNISFSISPALPAGLQFDPQTGTISGTLTASLSGSQEYTISATNCVGTATTTLTLNFNSPPSNITLSRTSVYEKNPAGITVGTLSTTDPDAGDTHTYTLLSGDLAAFTLTGNQIKTVAPFNYSIKNSYNIRVRTTDAGGLSFEKTLIINVLQAPVVSGTGNLPGSKQPTAPSSNPSISKGYSSQLNVSGSGIVSYSWSPSTGLSATNIANPVATPSQTATYNVTVTHSSGATLTLPITVTVITDFNITPNNLLTPNGDGQNDTWVVENLSTYPQAEVKVYDKAGRLVFSKRGYTNDWNGQYNGNTLATDTYYYIITFGADKPASKGYLTIVNNQ